MSSGACQVAAAIQMSREGKEIWINVCGRKTYRLDRHYLTQKGVDVDHVVRVSFVTSRRRHVEEVRTSMYRTDVGYGRICLATVCSAHTARLACDSYGCVDRKARRRRCKFMGHNAYFIKCRSP